MPIYEYRCESCETGFEALVRGPADAPECPACGDADHLAKQFSVPASAQVAGARGASSLPVCQAPPTMGGCGMGGCGMGGCGVG